MRPPTWKPRPASWLTRGIFLTVVAWASGCLNPRPEDDPSATDRSSAVNPNAESPDSPNAPDDSDLSPPLPPTGMGAANDPNEPNPNGLEGEPPPSSVDPDPSPSDAGVPLDGGSDASP